MHESVFLGKSLWWWKWGGLCRRVLSWAALICCYFASLGFGLRLGLSFAVSSQQPRWRQLWAPSGEGGTHGMCLGITYPGSCIMGTGPPNYTNGGGKSWTYIWETIVMENSRDGRCHEKSVCAPGRWKLSPFTVTSKQVHVQYLRSEGLTEPHQGGTARAAAAHWKHFKKSCVIKLPGERRNEEPRPFVWKAVRLRIQVK